MPTAKENFVFMWSQTPYTPSTWATSDALTHRPDLVPDIDNFHFFDGHIITSYMREDQLDEYFKRAGEKFLDPKYFADYRAKYFSEKETWWEWIRGIELKDYSTVPKESLAEDQEVFTRYMRDSIGYFCTTRAEFTYAAEQELESILKKYFGAHWLAQFETLISATVMDDIQKEHFEWLKLLGASRDQKSLKDHLSKFPWLVFGELDEGKAIGFLEEKIKQQAKAGYQDELTAFEQDKTDRLSVQNTIYGQLGSDFDRARYLAGFLQTQSVERMEIKSYWAGCLYLSRNMWQAISIALGVSVEDIFFYIVPPEVSRALRGELGADDLLGLKMKRQQYYAFDHVRDVEQYVIDGDKARSAFEERVQGETGQTDMIRGQVASTGRYTGRVRKVIVGDLDELQGSIKAFQEGEVLVTSMTQPNMMVIAKKAGAIVTDEGGITSHAAIISRELKVPCVVGCRQAMQVFQDGDMVEVDADKGVVRKL